MNKPDQIISAASVNRRALAQIGELPPARIDQIDLNGSFSFFMRRTRLILAFVLLGTVVGATICFMVARTFTAHAVVSLVQPPAELNATGVAVNSGPSPSSAFVDTQIEIIKSREMATQVAETLALLDGVNDDQRREILDDLQSGVSAERSGESFALLLAYRGATGEQAANRVNEFARQFSTWELRLAQERAHGEIETIKTRLDELRAEAANDTAQLAQYRIANNLLSTSGASLTEQEISSYNQAVTQARAQLAETRARLNTAMRQLRSGSTGDDVGEALGSTVIASLRIQEATTSAEAANLSAKYGPNHPLLINAREKSREIRSQIDAEIGRVISNLRAQLAVAEQRLSSLTGSLGSARSQLAQNNAAMVGLDELERNAEASQALYETYLNSYKRLVASEGTELPNARILTLAEVPFLPTSPNVLLNMALALVIGLGCGLLAAFVAESLSTAVWNTDQIVSEIGERYIGPIPLLGSIVKGEKNPITAIIEHPRSAFAEAFRILRISIEQTTFRPTQVLAVTSSVAKEGKTSTSACLGLTFAIAGARTVVVDCDEVKRGVTSLLRTDLDRPGLLEVLAGEVPLDQALISSEGGLSVLPIVGGHLGGERLLSGDAMDDLIGALRRRFDYVILDLPPVLPSAVSRKLAEKADGTLLVAQWRSTSVSAIMSALQQLPRDRINLIGIAMTKVDMRRLFFLGARDPFYHFRAYREYYA